MEMKKEDTSMKKLVSLILALIMILSMASFASAEQGKEVTVGIAGDPGNIGPFQGMGLGRIGILFTTYEMLMVKDGDTFRGCLMKELTKVDDLTYDVEIYDYIKDQAGNALTASDIKFCFDSAKATGNLPKLASVESVEVLSDFVARFRFTSLSAGELESLLMECPIVTQAAYEASADQMATDPVTTSPYRVVSYQTGSTIVYERNADYWQNDELIPTTSKHNVDKITFKIIPDPVQMVNALKTKEIDISSAIDGSYISDFMGAEGFDVTQIPDNTTKFLVFNSLFIPTAEERQAIAYAIDVDDIIAFAFDDIGYHSKTIGNFKYPDFVPAWEDEEYYEYDEAKAQELFAKAGVNPGKTYRLLYNVADDNTKIVTTIQSALGFLGMNVELIGYDNALFGTYKFDDKKSGEWDIMLDEAGSSDLLTNVWKLTLDRRNQTYGKTTGQVLDDTLQSLLEAAMNDNTPENMDAFHLYLKEQCYQYGLVSKVNNLAHTTVVTKAVTCFRGQILPGACEY